MLRSRLTKREEIADEDLTQGRQHGERPDARTRPRKVTG
jgi:hypothetical protein